MLFHLYTLTADAEQPQNLKLAWQNQLMRNFFKDLSPNGFMNLSVYHTQEYFCHWKGITCENDFVNEVAYSRFRHGNFHIHTLPPQLGSLFIESCKQKYRLNVRALPRNLYRLSLYNNKIYGRLDLTNLPMSLVWLNVSHNMLSGPISLESLPSTMERLHVHANRIQQTTVFYDNLPEKMTTLVLTSGGGNRIGEVRAVHPNKAVETKGVFSGMFDENVH
uniref:Leucine-rich repeat protein n=1 Tax=Paramoeba aestuarina TaxID=180227 RepID=A0A7S4PNZ7_9EUKA|mmetsp:Transcript_9892/g.14978  ORF Transcript_9892/g.14978 Transcript_9892/m.14978 type:complete len:220 (+) Transcript_9892:22-681(+)